jgi:pimeloyl-ACP methyl ester carboxylesterase
MSKNSISQFLLATTSERFRMILDKDHSDQIRNYLGQDSYNEYLNLAERVVPKLNSNHLAVDTPVNLVFIPGVMGSSLQSRVLGGTWWLDLRSLHRINDLMLAPDGQKDVSKNFQIIPSTTDISYEPFLGAVLEREDFGHAIFPYDWRKSLSFSSVLLKNKIIEIYKENGCKKIHLVAHSMGGLLVRSTLMQYGEELWNKLGRIIFLGTPHYGSPAIASYLKNHLWGSAQMALLGRFLSPETFRSLHGVIGMLPAPKGIYPGTREDEQTRWKSASENNTYIHPCLNFDMFQCDNWNLEFNDDSQKKQLQDILDKTYKFHEQMDHAHKALDQDYRNNMAVIAGVGFKTLFRLEYDVLFWGLWNRTQKIIDRIKNDPHRDGDESVPVASAALENIGETRYIKGKHGALTNIPEVYEDVFRWLNKERMQLSSTPSGALSEHLSSDIGLSQAPSLDGTNKSRFSLDYDDRWQPENTYADKLPEMLEKLEKGQLPEFRTVRLL